MYTLLDKRNTAFTCRQHAIADTVINKTLVRIINTSCIYREFVDIKYTNICTDKSALADTTSSKNYLYL